MSELATICNAKLGRGMDETEILPADSAANHPGPAIASLPYAKEIERLGTEIKDLYDEMHFGWFSVGADGVCTEINDVALAWLERSRAEVVGKKALYDWLTPESLKKIQHRDAVFNDADVDAFELDLVGRSGVVRPVALTTRTFADFLAKGAIHRSVLFDLTDQKKGSLSGHKIEALAFELMAGICITDHAGNILHFNKSFVSLTGYTRDELKGNIVQFVEWPHGLLCGIRF